MRVPSCLQWASCAAPVFARPRHYIPSETSRGKGDSRESIGNHRSPCIRDSREGSAGGEEKSQPSSLMEYRERM